MKFRPAILTSHRVLLLFLVLVFAWSIFSVNWSGPIIHTGGRSSFLKLWWSLFPPDLTPDFLWIASQATWTTFTFAVMGIVLAITLGLPMGVIASGILFERSSVKRVPLIIVFRGLLAGMRAVHELVWAVVLVVAIGLSPVAGIIALGIPYAGILGRIYAELLQSTPRAPIDALSQTGASQLKILFYGYIPAVLPDMLSYTFYRFECSIRAAAILSFIGIQGLGYQIQLSLHDLLFDQVWTLLLFLIVLIVLVDLWSTRIRRSLLA